MTVRPFLLIFILLFACAEKKSSREESIAGIKQTLATQVDAWNKGDVEAFMQGYWKSDSILFIGSAVTHGWTSTLARYRKSYPDKAAMGILKFDILRTDYISDDSYLITGKYHLTREHDAPEGIFTLLFQKKEGKWLVVYDHTS